MSCPNLPGPRTRLDEIPDAVEPGCCCGEHHPGLGVQPDPAPVVISIVTVGAPARMRADDALDELVAAARSTCTACRGDAERCREGTGAPSFRRLPGCAAWTADGTPKATKATPTPRQPWEPRPARAA